MFYYTMSLYSFICLQRPKHIDHIICHYKVGSTTGTEIALNFRVMCVTNKYHIHTHTHTHTHTHIHILTCIHIYIYIYIICIYIYIEYNVYAYCF